MNKKEIIDKINDFKVQTLSKLSKEKLASSKKKIIEKLKNNRNKIFLGVGITATMAFTFKSDETEYFDLSYLQVQTNDVTLNAVVLGGDTISHADFYRNVRYSYGHWIYSKKSYEKIYFGKQKKLQDGFFDFINQNSPTNNGLYYTKEKTQDLYLKIYTSNEDFTKRRIKNLKNGVKVVNDTIPISYKTELDKDSSEVKVMCSIEYKKSEKKTEKNTRINNKITYGYCSSDVITMNFFKTDPELSKEDQENVKKEFKRKYNIELDNFDALDHNKPGGDREKVYEHEEQHFNNDNNGVYTYGLKAEQIYNLRMHDELSANIKQLLAQREAYMETGDLESISNRFPFYSKAITDKLLNPAKNAISEDEIKLIANGARQDWDTISGKRFKSMYRDQIKNISTQVINKSLKYEIDNCDDVYNQILENIYTFKTKNGQVINMKGFIKEFELNDYDKKTLETIKTNRQTNETDVLARIMHKHGTKAFNAYINEQKRLVAKSDKARATLEAKISSCKFEEKNDKAYPLPENNREATFDNQRFMPNTRANRRKNKDR